MRVTDGTEAQDSVWSVRDQRYRDTQDSELSLTLLCYTDAQDHESTDQTSDCNAGEQQMLQTPLKMCSVKLVDCRNLIESREEETTAEQQQQSNEEEDFIPPGVFMIFYDFLLFLMTVECQQRLCRFISTDGADLCVIWEHDGKC